MQVAGDPVPVLVQQEPGGVRAARRETQGDGGLGGERGHKIGKARREGRGAVAAPDGEHAADVPRRAEREDGRGPDLAHGGAGGRVGALVGGQVGRRVRFPGGQDQAGQGPAGRQDEPEHRRGTVALGTGDRQPASLLVGQGEQGEVGAGQLPRLPGEVGQDLAGLGARQQPGGDLGAGLDPALLPLGRVIEARVLDGHAGRGAQGDEHRLVVFGELPAAALAGQVQVAEHLIADPDRDAEEAVHRRVPVGEARRAGVPGDVRQAERAGVVDQQAEQAASLRPVVDPRDLVLGQADRDELRQPLAVADDAERPVGRIHQADRGLDDPPQRGLQVQAGADRDDRLEQAAHPVPGLDDGLQPPVQLGEELVQLQVWQDLGAAPGTRFHGVSFHGR